MYLHALSISKPIHPFSKEINKSCDRWWLGAKSRADCGCIVKGLKLGSKKLCTKNYKIIVYSTAYRFLNMINYKAKLALSKLNCYAQLRRVLRGIKIWQRFSQTAFVNLWHDLSVCGWQLPRPLPNAHRQQPGGKNILKSLAKSELNLNLLIMRPKRHLAVCSSSANNGYIEP